MEIIPPSLPLKKMDFLPLRLSCKESSTSHPSPSSIVFTTPSVPLQGDRNLRGKGCNRPTRCSEPLRSWGGGPSEVYAKFCGLGAQGGMFADCPRLTSSSLLFRSALVDTRMRKIVFINLYLAYD